METTDTKAVPYIHTYVHTYPHAVWCIDTLQYLDMVVELPPHPEDSKQVGLMAVEDTAQ